MVWGQNPHLGTQKESQGIKPLSENLSPEIESIDKLKIDGTTYTNKTLNRLLDKLQLQKIVMHTKNNITAFYSPASPLSHYHVIDGKIKHSDGMQNKTSEHGYWHQCAR